jgi:hypothetical protein
MGLYQYIREQAHRNDIVGVLGRWLKSHPRRRPDHDSPAFGLASDEFAACGEWTRQDAVKRLNKNKNFQRIAKIEPKIIGIVSEIIKLEPHKGYSWQGAYHQFKTRISKLVGWNAEKQELVESDNYDVMIRVVDDLLPPDSGDLYPDGKPDDIDLDL